MVNIYNKMDVYLFVITTEISTVFLPSWNSLWLPTPRAKESASLQLKFVDVV